MGVDHDGADFCIEALESGPGQAWQAGHFPSTATRVQPVHQRRLYRRAAEAWRRRSAWTVERAGETTQPVERLWRSVKYEEVYPRAYDSVSEARSSIGRHLAFYNHRRSHSRPDRRTPDRGPFHAIAPRGGGMKLRVRGTLSGRATPSFRHAPRAEIAATNPGSSPLSLRGIPFRGSGLALTVCQTPGCAD